MPKGSDNENKVAIPGAGKISKELYERIVEGLGGLATLEELQGKVTLENAKNLKIQPGLLRGIVNRRRLLIEREIRGGTESKE